MMRGERKRDHVFAKEMGVKKERKKGNDRKMEDLIHGIITQAQDNCIRNQSCSKMSLGELESDVNPLPGSSSLLSLPENHTSINNYKMFVLKF